MTERPGEAANRPPAPRANSNLVGHDAVEGELRRLHEGSRLPHAILFGGPRGIGKATLAFRLARFILAPSDMRAGDPARLAIAADSEVFRRIAAGGHADLLTIERMWDPRRRRLSGEITVEHTREVAEFLHLTAAEGGWRIVVVDGAEEMNRNAANMLLKILEEPPRRSLLLLVGHNPSALLPTIRSRCRRFRLGRLAPPLVAGLLARYRPQLDGAEAAALCSLSGGSIGRALDLADAGGLGLYRALLELLGQAPALDTQRLHGFADSLAGAEAEGRYRAFGELLLQCLARIASAGARRDSRADPHVDGEADTIERLAAAGPARWARLRQQIETDFAAARDLNLDRKQAVLGAFFAIAETAR